MASTSAIEEGPGSAENVFEEIIDGTDWMNEEDDHQYLSDKKMVYGHNHVDGQGTGEEYHDVDVEEYDAVESMSNLPDLLSKRCQVGNDTVTLCFSKQGVNQIALDGYLYNLVHADESNSTWDCINPECTARIVSNVEMTVLSKENNAHCDICLPDEAQLRIRISIYDLRLLAEFTDADLQTLYNSSVTQFDQDNPELLECFPTFNALHRSLEDHRRNKLYRRVFDSRSGEVDKRFDHVYHDDENLLMSSIGEEVVEESYGETVPTEGELAMIRAQQLNPYGRTRGFPPTFCVDCGIGMPAQNRSFTPQHALVQHVNRIHQPIKILTFTFEPSAFEMWLREVQRCPSLRFRRFSLIGEDMYYLCSCDARLPRSKYNASTQTTCCTAYIKIFDYRIVSARVARIVNIEYAFEHFGHETAEETHPSEKTASELRPESFLFQMERRKHFTANLVRNKAEAQRRYSIEKSLPVRPTIQEHRMRVGENVFSSSRSDNRTSMSRMVTSTTKPPVRLSSIRLSSSRPAEVLGMISKRSNFKDESVYEAVRDFEQLSHVVIRRLQNVKSVKIAQYYSTVMQRMVNRIVGDIECAPDGSAQTVWSGLNAPRNGMKPCLKRRKYDEDEERETEGTVRKSTKRDEEKEEEEKGDMTREGETEGDKIDEEVEKGDEEQPRKEHEGASEGETRRINTRGRSQLPVKNTLLATGRINEKEKEEREVVKEGETSSVVSTVRRRTMTPLVNEETEKSVTPSRLKSSRIQARKEKEEGVLDEKKT